MARLYEPPHPRRTPNAPAHGGWPEDVYRGPVTWQPLADFIETERLTLPTRDERDAEWYRELVGERGEDLPTREEPRVRRARVRDL